MPSLLSKVPILLKSPLTFVCAPAVYVEPKRIVRLFKVEDAGAVKVLSDHIYNSAPYNISNESSVDDAMYNKSSSSI